MNSQQAPLGVVGTLAVAGMGILSVVVTAWTSNALVGGCTDALRLRNAVMVDALILNMDVVERGEAGDAVYFTYTYEFEGTRYQHRTRRLATFARSGELQEQLRDALNNEKRVRCYVDPDRPSLSVFSREFSVPLFLVSAIFPIAFGMIAVLIAASLIQRLRETWCQSWAKRTQESTR